MSSKSLKLLKLLKNPDRDTFQFTVAFQLEVIRYFIQCKDSILHISNVKASYFTLLEHCLIFEAILKTYKKYRKIPSEVILNEEVSNMLNSKDYAALSTKEDLVNIGVILHELYTHEILDEDVIKSYLLKFIAFIQVKELNESTDFTAFENYVGYQQKLAHIIREASGQYQNQEPAHYMVVDTTSRQLQRRIDPEVVKSPSKQLNILTNANGFPTSSIIVLLDKAKARKTFALINMSRGYLTMQKNVLYIDTENGSSQLMGRMIQSTLKKTKLELLSGDYDRLEKNHMRKYKRMGVEFIVKRVQAMVADANTIRGIIQEVEQERNIKVHVLMIDYAGKLASSSRDKDDYERISNVYIDIQNLALDLKLDAVWTAHHVTRDGAKHQETRYEESDISGAISIIRNAQCIIGLNSTAEERENNIQRMEIVVQRDGKPEGRAVFNVDVERQYMKELSREARRLYDESQGEVVDQLISKENGNSKKKRIGPNADLNKSKHRSGEI